jgi:hypothetical protein
VDARRRQILEDMGILVWRQRAPAGALVQAPDAPQAAPTPVFREDHRGLSERRREPTSPTVRRGTGRSGQPVRPPPALGDVPSAETPATETPAHNRALRETAPASCDRLEIHSMAVPGALLFADRSAKAFRHLYTDVLRAVAGDWCADPVVLRFDWPIPGVNGSPAEALGAFVDKQIGDFEARRVLVLAELAPLFGRLDRSFESIAGGDTLDDPVVKSELWQRIRTARD